ncbi:DUF2461 domain-containing protein [Rathayibacter soli]|uniref:DUF2461 domain-containing protein n=1 Tax=Rathayibacter soli TaxID=3144168 RepID=UPI0027E4D977|nr:DUF2461 domain-containing protein [Glaciibacter superstes]
MSAFDGWSAVATEFFRGLEADNSKAYWTENKSVYDQAVLAPMQALLGELGAEFGKSKIFRPNRDIRFSADKSPYKTAIGATIGRGYVQFSAHGIGVGAGYYTMASDQIDRYRTAVANGAQGERLQRLIAELTGTEFAGAGVKVTSRDALKTVPRGYPKDHPRADLLRKKDLAAWARWPSTDSWMQTAAAKDHVAAILSATRPLVDWLDENVGDTTLDRQR